MRHLTMWMLALAVLMAAGCTMGSVAMRDQDYSGGSLFGYGDSDSGGGGASLFADDDEEDSGGGAAPLSVKAEKPVFLAQVGPRKVIYAAEVAVDVANIEKALEATKKMAEEMGGYMQRMTSEHIIVRVPAVKFDAALDRLAKMGNVTEKNITASDVTEEYIDLDLRLKNAKALLEKLQALLAKADTVKDALAVEKELARVRTEVERLEGRLNRLTDRIAYSTVSAAFSQMESVPGRPEVNLPFWWLQELGLEGLLYFDY